MNKNKRLFILAMVLFLLFSCVSPALAVLNKPYDTEPTSPVWHTYDPALHYYYQQLSTVEKRLFSARYDAIALGKPELWDFPVSGANALNRSRAYYALTMDCPELMFMNESMFWDELPRPAASFWTEHPREMERKLQECAAALEEIRAMPEWGETDFDKEWALDRYLVTHCEYEVETYETTADFVPDAAIRTAHSALVYGKAVCLGYAYSVAFALRCFGIECLVTTGRITWPASREGDGHAWNMAKIDGDWYVYDPTWEDAWDSPENAYREAFTEDFAPFFNVTNSLIRRTHSIDHARVALNFTNPQCTATAQNYYVRKGQEVRDEWRQRVPELLRQAKEEGKKALGIAFLNETPYREAIEYLESPLHLMSVAVQIGSVFDYFPIDEGWMIYFVLL